MLKLKEGMIVQIRPNTFVSNCNCNDGHCVKCMKGKLVVRNHGNGLKVYEHNGKGKYCSSIPKNAIIPFSWREKYAKNRD